MRVAEVDAGTQVQERELALAYMWQIHVETGPRRVAEAITGTAQICCGKGRVLHDVGGWHYHLCVLRMGASPTMSH